MVSPSINSNNYNHNYLFFQLKIVILCLPWSFSGNQSLSSEHELKFPCHVLHQFQESFEHPFQVKGCVGGISGKEANKGRHGPALRSSPTGVHLVQPLPRKLPKGRRQVYVPIGAVHRGGTKTSLPKA